MKLYYNVEFESLNVKIDYTYHVKTWHVKAGDQLGWIGSHSNFGFQHWRIRLFDSGSTLQRRSKNSEWVYSTHLFVHIWRLPKLLYYRIRVIIGWLVWSRREFKPPDYHHYYSNKMSLLMLALHCIYMQTWLPVTSPLGFLLYCIQYLSTWLSYPHLEHCVIVIIVAHTLPNFHVYSGLGVWDVTWNSSYTSIVYSTAWSKKNLIALVSLHF